MSCLAGASLDAGSGTRNVLRILVPSTSRLCDDWCHSSLLLLVPPPALPLPLLVLVSSTVTVAVGAEEARPKKVGGIVM
jgi:hypothetical protein